MTSRPKFDTGDFVRGFRAACTRRGINPLEGANSFEVVHFRAEQKVRQVRLAQEARGKRWWRRQYLWRACPPYHSKVEEAAIWNLFLDGYTEEMNRIARKRRRRRREDVPLRECLTLRESLPLREIHRLQKKGKKDGETQELQSTDESKRPRGT